MECQIFNTFELKGNVFRESVVIYMPTQAICRICDAPNSDKSPLRAERREMIEEVFQLKYKANSKFGNLICERCRKSYTQEVEEEGTHEEFKNELLELEEETDWQPVEEVEVEEEGTHGELTNEAFGLGEKTDWQLVEELNLLTMYLNTEISLTKISPKHYLAFVYPTYKLSFTGCVRREYKEEVTEEIEEEEEYIVESITTSTEQFALKPLSNQRYSFNYLHVTFYVSITEVSYTAVADDV